jgi:hypothetical protein
LIGDFKIRSALPALEKLARYLARSPAVGAPDELERINRVMIDLASST